MFDIIIGLIIFGAVIASKKKKNEKNAQTNVQTNVQTPKGGAGTYYQRPQTQSRNFAMMPEHKKVAPNVERKCMVEDKHRSEMQTHVAKVSQQVSVPNVKREYTQASQQTREQKKRHEWWQNDYMKEIMCRKDTVW